MRNPIKMKAFLNMLKSNEINEQTLSQTELITELPVQAKTNRNSASQAEWRGSTRAAPQTSEAVEQSPDQPVYSA